MSEAIKPTPGVWSFSVGDDPDDWPGYFPVVASDTGYEVVGREGMYGDRKTDIANAALIAEAGTVHHETGLTPRQLVEQRDALAEVLQKLASAFMSHTRWNGDPPAEVAEARAALALLKGAKP